MNNSSAILLFLDIDGVLNNYQTHIKMEQIFDDFEKKFQRNVNHFTKEQNDFLLSEMMKNNIRLCFTKTDFHLKTDNLFPYFGFIDLQLYKQLIQTIINKSENNQLTTIDVVIISSWGCGLRSQFPNKEKQFYLDIFNDWLIDDIKINVIDIIENISGVAKVRLEQVVQFIINIDNQNEFKNNYVKLFYADDTSVRQSDIFEIKNFSLISEFNCYENQNDLIKNIKIKLQNKFYKIDFLDFSFTSKH